MNHSNTPTMRYARAYYYDTADPTYFNAKAHAIQQTKAWLDFCTLLYKLGICVVY